MSSFGDDVDSKRTLQSRLEVFDTCIDAVFLGYSRGALVCFDGLPRKSHTPLACEKGKSTLTQTHRVLVCTLALADPPTTSTLLLPAQIQTPFSTLDPEPPQSIETKEIKMPKVAAKKTPARKTAAEETIRKKTVVRKNTAQEMKVNDDRGANVDL